MTDATGVGRFGAVAAALVVALLGSACVGPGSARRILNERPHEVEVEVVETRFGDGVQRDLAARVAPDAGWGLPDLGDERDACTASDVEVASVDGKAEASLQGLVWCSYEDVAVTSEGAAVRHRGISVTASEVVQAATLPLVLFVAALALVLVLLRAGVALRRNIGLLLIVGLLSGLSGCSDVEDWVIENRLDIPVELEVTELSEPSPRQHRRTLEAGASLRINPRPFEDPKPGDLRLVNGGMHLSFTVRSDGEVHARLHDVALHKTQDLIVLPEGVAIGPAD